MSYRNGYTNNHYAHNSYDDNNQDQAPVRNSHQRRAGGYGGFYDSTLAVPAEPEQSPSRPQFRPQATDELNGGSGLFGSGTRDADDYNSSRGQERTARAQDAASSLHGAGPGGRQIEGRSTMRRGHLRLRLARSTLEYTWLIDL